MFRLPRNLSFIEKLPVKFLLKVLKERNKTPEGRWYLVEINNQRLNLLSEKNLREGELLEMEKQETLCLKIVRSVSEPFNEEKLALSKDHQVDVSG